MFGGILVPMAGRLKSKGKLRRLKKRRSQRRLEEHHERQVSHVLAFLSDPHGATLVGHVDSISPERIAGWVLSPAAPAEPLVVAVFLGGHVIGLGETGLDRADVQTALTDGGLRKHRVAPGFDLALPRDALVHAFADLAAREDANTAALSLEVVVPHGGVHYGIATNLPSQTVAAWLEDFGIAPSELDSTRPAPRIAVPRFGDRDCGSLDDCIEAVPSRLCETVARSPFFQRDRYISNAIAANLPLASSLNTLHDLAVAAHFCSVGAPAAIAPGDQLGFEESFYSQRYGGDGDLPAVLDFIRLWNDGVRRFPSARSAQIAERARDVFTSPADDIKTVDGPLIWAAAVGLYNCRSLGLPAHLNDDLRLVAAAVHLARYDLDDLLAIERPAIDRGETDNIVAAINQNGLFDAPFYRSRYGKAIGPGVDPVRHYVEIGERRGFRPNDTFDPKFYLRTNSDVRRHAQNALQHYISHGQREGRACRPQSRERHRPEFGKPILFVGHAAMRTGAERVLLEILRWISEHTRRPLAVYLLDGGPLVAEFSHYADVIVAPDDKVTELAMRHRLLEQDWEFIYLNTVVSGRFLANIGEATLSGTRIVAHIHEMQQVLMEYESALTLLLKHTDHIVSASPECTKLFLETYNVAPDRLTEARAFIRPLANTPEEIAECRAKARSLTGLAPEDRVFVGCGTVYWRKGTDIFVDAAIRFLKDTDPSATFIWIGGGEDLHDLRAKVEQHGLSERIRLVGERDDAAFLISAGDVFILTSREDPFPLVVLEAAQYSIPTLYIEGTTGIGAFVGDDAGYAVKQSDAEAIAASLAGIVSDPQDTRAKGHVARERLLATYTSEAQVKPLFYNVCRAASVDPLVSVIVPNYNHERYLPERLSSIFDQTMLDFEVIVLDDASSDDSVAVIKEHIADQSNAKLIRNRKNSGDVFAQWRKGLARSRGKFVWIAESDDTCEPRFLSMLVDAMAQSDVMIAAGNTIPFTAAGGRDPKALRNYYDTQCPGLFETDFKLDGDRFVNLGMGAACLLVNASGLLFRTELLRAHIDKGSGYSMCGDWAIYLHILRHGKVAYVAGAVNLFRRHQTSRVQKVEGTNAYFTERRRIADLVCELFPITRSLQRRIEATLRHELDRFRDRVPELSIRDVLPTQRPTLLQFRRRIALYVHGMLFSKGGIERLGAQIANALAARGYEVHILCRHWGEARPVFSLHDNVIVTPVFSEDAPELSIREIHTYLIEQQIELLVPMLSEWIFAPVIEAGVRAGVPILASEHNDPWKIEELWWSREDRHAVLARADRIHLLSESFKRSLPPSLQSRTVVIPNGVDLDLYRPGPASREKLFVAAGRLALQKRIDLLIEAFALSGLAANGWRLDIYGSGDLQASLQDQIRRLQLGTVVRLRGTAENMSDVFAKASITVLPSDFEGFGIVVVESMAAGTPVIAFSDCNGPNEIIRHGIDGRLARPGRQSRAAALSSAMKSLAQDKALNGPMRRAARERAGDYQLNTILDSWVEAIEDTVTGGDGNDLK